MATHLIDPTQDKILEAAVDITNVLHHVEIDVRADGQVLWVNVDGVCLVRISRLHPQQLTIRDNRET